MAHKARFIAGQFSRWAAASFPDRTAVVYRDRRISYRGFDEQANRCANALIGLGLETGDRVAVLLRNSIEALVAGQAIERAGLAYVRLQPAESIPERRHVLDDSGARAMLMEQGFVDDWLRSEEGHGWSGHVIAVPEAKRDGVRDYRELLDAASPEPPEVLVSGEDLTAVAYTAGTTGRPKGVVYTVARRRNAVRNLFLNEGYGISEHDVLLTVAPVTHAAGAFTHMYALRGATNVILDRFDAGEVLETIQRERVTAVFMVPTMLYRMVHHPEVDRFDLSSLKMLYYAAAPMPVATLRAAIQLLPHCRFRQHYGLTEQPQPVTYLHAEDHFDVSNDHRKLERLASVGRPVMGVELKIMTEDRREVAAGEPGEIWVRTDYGMVEYWRNPEATADTIIDGWVRTGDVGRLDADGYLYLEGRTKDMIISGGFNVYPREVEQVIEEIPAVAEVVVIGVPDDEWGESVKAVITVRDGATLTEDEVIEHCRSRLTRYKKPRFVEFVEDFPRNPAGKPLRYVLRDAAWKGRDRKI
jgi:acyl-CoA synthetase (AMP-forming)/AMP-acid ligase II